MYFSSFVLIKHEMHQKIKQKIQSSFRRTRINVAYDFGCCRFMHESKMMENICLLSCDRISGMIFNKEMIYQVIYMRLLASCTRRCFILDRTIQRSLWWKLSICTQIMVVIGWSCAMCSVWQMTFSIHFIQKYRQILDLMMALC